MDLSGYTPSALSLLVGLQEGFHSISDAVTWADAEIVRFERPSDALMDLAMALSDRQVDAHAVLRDLIGTPEPRQVVEIRLAFIYRMLMDRAISLDAATRRLYALTSDDGLFPEERDSLYYFDDAYELAMNGTFGSTEKVLEEVISFTRPFWDRLRMASAGR
jgi:hypothetical protein